MVTRLSLSFKNSSSPMLAALRAHVFPACMGSVTPHRDGGFDMLIEVEQCMPRPQHQLNDGVSCFLLLVWLKLTRQTDRHLRKSMISSCSVTSVIQP
jgi:hypothetical protein